MELEIKDTTDRAASYRDRHREIESEERLISNLYYKGFEFKNR
jgi:hypothetical protein